MSLFPRLRLGRFGRAAVMDRLILQVLFLELLLHFEVGLSFALDSLLLVVTNDTSVHSLYKVSFNVLWRDEPLTALSACCEKWTKATTPIAVAQVVANVIWDARDMLAIFVYVKSICGNSRTIRDLICPAHGPGATRWTCRQGRGRSCIIGLSATTSALSNTHCTPAPPTPSRW